MTRPIVALLTIISILSAACQSKLNMDSGKNKNSVSVNSQNETKLEDIPFTLAKNYFVNNTLTELDNPKIETVEKFNEIFGMATTMTKEGKPTEIDFNIQYVIAVILPETDIMTNIEPFSLKKNTKREITLTYKSVTGQKQSFTTRPNFAIVVNKSENGNVTLKKIK